MGVIPWWTLTYVASTVAVNVIWGVVPWLGSFIVGAIFMVRDAAQEEVGPKVLWATALGVGISYVAASPGVALASAAAFGIGEGLDFVMCHLLRGRSLRQRMFLTQPVNVAVDSAIFLLGLQLGIGLPWSWSLFGIQCGSKMVALVALAWPRSAAAQTEEAPSHDAT